MPPRLVLFARVLPLALVLLVACAAPTDDAPEAETESIGQTSSPLVAVAAFGTNPAQLKMHKYVPQAVGTGARPLVVVLHGCTQTPAAYESAGWNSLADEWKFFVVYAEQNNTRNNSSGCFNWGGRWKSAPSAFVFSPEPLMLDEIKRGNGENQSIKEMVDQMKKDHTIDDKRVFITGLSAGGAMTALMLATWPDVFAGGAIFAGVPYGCATDRKTTTEAAACLKDYSGENAYLSRTPKAWGDLVRGAAPSFKGPYPRVQIWHGTADAIVNAKNQAELVKQWTDVNGIDQTADTKDTIDTYPHEQFKDGSGKVIVETFQITGKSHGTEVAASTPIDPGKKDGPKCGKAGSYIIEAGICSTYYAAKFFGLDGSGAPGTTSSGGVSSSSSTSSGGGEDGGGGAGPQGGASGGPGGKWIEGSNGSTCAMSARSSCVSVTSLGLLATLASLFVARRRCRRGTSFLCKDHDSTSEAHTALPLPPS
jgi:poly(hydroxyalkanoate) depolymerase family esterase